MNPKNAHDLAKHLCGAFSASDGQVETFTTVIKDYSEEEMGPAVREAVKDCEKMPTPKVLMAIFYRLRNEKRTAAMKTGDIPCGPCLREGGWRIRPGGALNPPTAAVVPFIQGYCSTPDADTPAVLVWDAESCCPIHATEVTRLRREAQVKARELKLARKSADADFTTWDGSPRVD